MAFSPFSMFGGAGGGDTTSMIIQWVFFIVVFIYLLPKLYMYQIFAKCEQGARKLEMISKKGQDAIVGYTAKFGRERKDIRNTVDKFVDFFAIGPVDLDPYGIIKKLEHIINKTEARFREVAKEIAPQADSEKMMDVYMSLQAGVTIQMVAKIVRHFAEMAKKFKNLQFAMIIQMQLPLIMKIVESEYEGLKAFLDGHPVGDGIGPYVAASLVDKEGKEVAEDVVLSLAEMEGRKLYVMKAKGPGGRLGKVGKAVQEVCKKVKISKIITIDAAGKLEGEKTGRVNEGVGVAMGGSGVERSQIEEVAVAKDLPLDAVAVKMSQFEAIYPMPEEVINAADEARAMVREFVLKEKPGSHIIIVGVGNTCGVPNSRIGLEAVKQKVLKVARRMKEEERQKSKKGFAGLFRKKPKKDEWA